MKRLAILLLTATFFTACTSGAGKSQGSDRKVVVAYVTSWTDVMPDPSLITHINYAFGGVNRSFDGVRISNEGRLRQIAGLKEVAPDLKICLSIGGWGSGNFSEMAASDSLRSAFAADCRRVVDEFGLDGIDIDWEYPTSSSAGISSSPDDTANYTLLMRDLRSALGEGKLLTLASVCSAKYIDFEAILPYIDFVNIMSYDMGWAPQHNAPLYRSNAEGEESPIAGGWTADEAVKAHLEAGIPAHMLVMGMPFYGRGERSSYGDYKNYKDITGPREGDTEVWDEIARVPYYAGPDGQLLLGFDNMRSIQEKCDYIVAGGLKGAMYWDYSGDNAGHDLAGTIARTIIQ